MYDFQATGPIFTKLDTYQPGVKKLKKARFLREDNNKIEKHLKTTFPKSLGLYCY